jgi:hypothetical protein
VYKGPNPLAPGRPIAEFVHAWRLGAGSGRSDVLPLGTKAHLTGVDMPRLLAAIALSGVLMAQDKDAERQAEKEYEKKVKEAISAFKKEFKGTDVQKCDALQKLAGLVHDSIFPEISPCLRDTDMVRKKAIDLLSGMDHPTSADLLASAVADNLKSKDLASAMVKASTKCMWDKLYIELSYKLLDKAFDKELSSTTFEYLMALEKAGPISAVDGLIKLLKKFEDNSKNGGGNDQYGQQIKKALKACCGEEKATSKDYEVWWKASREQLMTKVRVVRWCKKTGKRWDALASDSKAYCPHHGDKKLAQKDPPVIAFATLK